MPLWPSHGWAVRNSVTSSRSTEMASKTFCDLFREKCHSPRTRIEAFKDEMSRTPTFGPIERFDLLIAGKLTNSKYDSRCHNDGDRDECHPSVS